MSLQITFSIFKGDEFRGAVDWLDGESVVLGRQLTTNEDRFRVNNDRGQLRIAFAPNQDAMYSRNHLLVTKTVGATLVITNIATSGMPVFVSPAFELRPQESVERVLPTSISLQDYSIRIERSLKSLTRQTRFVRDFDSARPEVVAAVVAPDDQAASEKIAGMIQHLSIANSILQQANTRDDLYSKAIDAVKSLIDVDGVAIINAGNVNDVFARDPIVPSLAAVESVRDSRQVRWTPPEQEIDVGQSPRGLDCFIAAPILRPRGSEESVVAVLYAHRLRPVTLESSPLRQPLSEIVAQIFELIACSVAAGLVRIENQSTQNLFQQFFSEKLAKRLLQGETILEPCEREITVMFCDIRLFSSISERIGPAATSEWVQDVMTHLSECVHEFDGVVVDYIGDEIMAMWGAPDDLPNHAVLACRCAHRMMQLAPGLDQKWRPVIEAETRFGIGINSGRANVGNTGSAMRFKYGPLGNCVNQASRVQGLTKYLRVNAIITGETQKRLQGEFPIRRLGKAKVVNIAESIELFELCPEASPGTSERSRVYELALRDLEQGNLTAAAGLLKSLNLQSPDHPTLLIMQEIIQRVIYDRHAGEFAWSFDNK